MDKISNWGDVTIGVDLIDQVGSFDAASIAKSLGSDLQTVADSMSAATVGVSTDLEAAAQGLGYGSLQMQLLHTMHNMEQITQLIVLKRP